MADLLRRDQRTIPARPIGSRWASSRSGFRPAATSREVAIAAIQKPAIRSVGALPHWRLTRYSRLDRVHSVKREEILAAADPLAETRACAGLSRRALAQWNDAFDVGGFVWAEIEARARRVLWEVHTLGVGVRLERSRDACAQPRAARDVPADGAGMNGYLAADLCNTAAQPVRNVHPRPGPSLRLTRRADARRAVAKRSPQRTVSHRSYASASCTTAEAPQHNACGPAESRLREFVQSCPPRLRDSLRDRTRRFECPVTPAKNNVVQLRRRGIKAQKKP